MFRHFRCLLYQLFSLLCTKFFEHCVKRSPKKFNHFHMLPPEIRCLVYSKMELPERAQMARASAEALRYFQHHLVKVQGVFVTVITIRTNHFPVFLNELEEKDGVASMTVHYDHVYEERHILSESMKTVLRTELDSYINCACTWCCTDRLPLAVILKLKKYRPPRPVHFSDCSSINDALFTMQLTRVYYMSIVTEPFGGLVESLQPSLTIFPMRQIAFRYHEKKRNYEQHLDLSKWTKWIDFSCSDRVCISVPGNHREVDKRFFDIDGVRRAKTVNACVRSAVDLAQINRLRAENLTIIPIQMTQNDQKELFRRKLMEWIANPRICCQTSVLTQHWNSPERHCLVEIVKHLLEVDIHLGPDFQVYHDWNCIRNSHRNHCLSLRNSKEKSELLVIKTGFITYSM